MIVIILAAGEGSRLYPYTKNIPKCMVKYENKSIISHQLNIFKKVKIKRIYLVSGYKSSKIRFNQIKKRKNTDYKNSNMVFSLFKYANLFNGKQDIIVSYGDIIYKKEVIQKLIGDNNNLSTIIDLDWYKYWKKRFKNPLKDAETLKTDRKNFITDIGKKTKHYKNIKGQYIGLTKIQKEISQRVLRIWLSLYKSNNKSKIKNLFFTDFLRILIKKKIKLKAVYVRRGWLEFDQPIDLKIKY